MNDRQRIIFNLLKEIHETCVENNIDYFLVGKISRYGYKYNTMPDVNAGTIAMSAYDLGRFIEVFNRNPIRNRAIEYMGNSEFFPGFFLNYVNEETTFYNRKRLACEKKLGMYVKIIVEHPSNVVLRSFENAWQTVSFGSEVKGSKLEPIIKKRLEKKILQNGRSETARRMFDFFKNNYSIISGKTRKAFAKYKREIIIDGQIFWVKDEIDSNEQQLNGIIESKNRDLIGQLNTSENVFWDTEISYHDLHLDDFTTDIRTVFQQMRNHRIKEKKIKTARNENVEIMLRTYNRYYFGLQFENRIDELNNLLEMNQYEQFDLEVDEYLRELMKYEKIYISEKLSKLMEKRYGTKVGDMFKDVPEIYKKGIDIFDYDGQFIRKVNN